MIYWIVKGISKLPFPVLYGISTLLYWIVGRLIGYRKKVVYSNLRNSFPKKSEQEIHQIAQDFYRLFCDFIVETIKSLDMTPEELLKRLRFEGKELLYYLDRGQPIVGVIGHQMNWEWAWQAACLYAKRPLDGVYKPLKSPAAEKLMLELRGKTGGRLIPAKRAMKYMFDSNDVTVYGLAGDQTPGNNPKNPPYWRTFLGQDTAFFKGMAVAAPKKGMPVVYFDIIREKRGYYLVKATVIAEPPYSSDQEDTSIIDRYAEALEASIQKDPVNWLWSHRRWKGKRPQQ